MKDDLVELREVVKYLCQVQPLDHRSPQHARPLSGPTGQPRRLAKRIRRSP